MSAPCPARIVGELGVDRPYPHHWDDSELVRLRQRILERLGQDGSW